MECLASEQVKIPSLLPRHSKKCSSKQLHSGPCGDGSLRVPRGWAVGSPASTGSPGILLQVVFKDVNVITKHVNIKQNKKANPNLLS